MADTNPSKTGKPADKTSGRDAIREMIFDQTAVATEQAINDKIENEKNQIRNGDGSFLGTLKGLFFRLAELFHLDKWLAKFFGTPIPEDREIKAIARQVAGSVSDTLTNDPAVKTMTPEELQKTITEQVASDLQQHRGEFPSFTDKQLAETAATVGEKTRDNFKEIKKGIYPEKPVARDVPLKGSPEEQVKQTLSVMADGLMDEIPPEKASQAQLIKQSMIAIGAGLIKAHPELIQKPDELAKQYVDAVQKDAGLVEKLKQFDPKFDLNKKGTSELLALALTKQLEVYKDTLASAVKGNAKEIAPKEVDQSEVINTKIAQTVAATIRETAIDGAKEIFWAPADKKILKSPGDYSPAKIEEAQEHLYKFAVSKGYVFNNDQRDKIGQIVADATMEVLKNPAYKGLPQKDMADRIQANVEAQLKSRQKEIDDGGYPSVSTVNYNRGTGYGRWNKPKDTLAEIAEKTAASIRDPNDPDGAYKTLAETQATLLKQQAAKALQNTSDKNAAKGAINAGTGNGLTVTEHGAQVVPNASGAPPSSAATRA